MLGLSWPEILVIGAVAVVVIGPKELPAVMRGLGRLTRRVQYIKYAFSQQFEEFLKESDLEELRSMKKDMQVFDEQAFDEDFFEEVNFETKRPENEHIEKSTEKLDEQ